MSNTSTQNNENTQDCTSEMVPLADDCNQFDCNQTGCYNSDRIDITNKIVRFNVKINSVHSEYAQSKSLTRTDINELIPEWKNKKLYYIEYRTGYQNLDRRPTEIFQNESFIVITRLKKPKMAVVKENVYRSYGDYFGRCYMRQISIHSIEIRLDFISRDLFDELEVTKLKILRDIEGNCIINPDSKKYSCIGDLSNDLAKD